MPNPYESHLIKIPASEVVDELYGQPPGKGDRDIADFRKKNIKKPEGTENHELGEPNVIAPKKQDWYESDPVFTEDITGGWALVAKEAMPNSTGKNYLDQTEEIVKYLKETVFKDSPLPREYQEAIEEFNKAKEGIRKIISSDWQTAAAKLAGLKVTELARQTPAEAFFDIFAYYLTNNERIMEKKYAWTRRHSSDGGLVAVGRFDVVGASALSWSPDGAEDLIGVAFSRSH